MRTIKDFLTTVVTGERGYFCLAVGSGGRWLEHWFQWPQDVDEIVACAEKYAPKANVYFSSYLFKAPQSIKENVLPTRTVQADLDNADLANITHEPTVLLETSPGRHQGYWILDRAVDLEQHEGISKKITYSIKDCDRSGWPLGRKVRILGTQNHKYFDGPKPVRLVRFSGKTYDPDEFEALPDVPQYLSEHFDEGFIEDAKVVDADPVELLGRIKPFIPVKVYLSYSVRQEDRSEALWGLLVWAFKAGLNRAEVFTLAKFSANNKFADLKHRADQDLAKDVLRAELAVKSNIQDVKQVIQDLYKNQLTALERKQQIYNVVLKEMKENGVFLHTNEGLAWYIRRDVGRPIGVADHSEMLQSLMYMQFGLNPTQEETRYVLSGLKAYTLSLPENAVSAALSRYDPHERYLLLHTGRRTVLKITASGIEQAIDGAYNTVFPWDQTVEEFTPLVGVDPPLDWGEELFGDGVRGFGSSVQNITNMTPEQAKALLKVWTIFVLFRNVIGTRPIIASFGAPGSGKSTMFKKVYALFYGRMKSLTGVSSQDDFDQITASDPLVVFDNVDTWEKWLPDRIALSASLSSVTRRKLWTDADSIVLTRQAIVGVTAHNPKFGREDVADRFLLFIFRRFDTFVDEESILSDIMKRRNAIWGSVVRDIQKILSTPLPANGKDVPQFRIEDFARYGLWIARAIGVEGDFVHALNDVYSSQRSFSLEEEGLLVSAVTRYAETAKSNGKLDYKTPSQLWSILESCSDDPRAFSSTYRNAVMLGKKLISMQNPLGLVVDIHSKDRPDGTKTWCIRSKSGDGT